MPSTLDLISSCQAGYPLSVWNARPVGEHVRCQDGMPGPSVKISDGQITIVFNIPDPKTKTTITPIFPLLHYLFSFFVTYLSTRYKN